MFGVIPQVFLIGIRLYRTCAAALGMRSPCRFYPSCSVYAEQAIRKFGAAQGLWMATHRLLRCHPWNPGGIDPPQIFSDNQ